MKVTFHGVRGSTPVFGDAYRRVGGHTSCVAVSFGDELPRLVLDAGTGLQRLARDFGDAPFSGTILLTHLHWDHLQGLPFFGPADRDDATCVVFQPAQGDPIEVLAGSMAPPHFPISPLGLNGTWTFAPLEEGPHQIEGCSILAREIPHKGGRTFGYRVDADGSSIAYLPDHDPTQFGPGPEGLGEYHEAALELALDADVLIHGAPFVATEAARAAAFGHATAEYAAGLAAHAGAGRLVFTHHSPWRDDATVARIADLHGATPAVEGLSLHLGNH